MGIWNSIVSKLGAGQEPRRYKPESGNVAWPELAAIFGEANPMAVTDTPRPVGIYPATAEPIHGKPLAVANGWIDRPNQTKGMSVLMVDHIVHMPDAEVRGITASAINHSRYVPYNHPRNQFWMNSNWDPIYRYANTNIDLRWSVGHPTPLSNQQPTNVPSGARMGPYAAPFRTAWRVPRFSTEPYTIIPQPQG